MQRGAKLWPKCACGCSRSRHRDDGPCIRCDGTAPRRSVPCPKYRPRRGLKARKTDPAKRRFASKRNKAYTDWVSGLPCLLRNMECWHPETLRTVGKYSDPAHVNKTRGAGAGDEGEVVNLCRTHHELQEGRTTEFNRWYGVDLKALATALWVRYEKEVLGRSL